jgi:hypothetical protein
MCEYEKMLHANINLRCHWPCAFQFMVFIHSRSIQNPHYSEMGRVFWLQTIQSLCTVHRIYSNVSVDSSEGNLFQLLLTKVRNNMSAFISTLNILLTSKHFLFCPKRIHANLIQNIPGKRSRCHSFPASSSIHLYGHDCFVVQGTLQAPIGTMSFTFQTNR